jgi:hypothetical protein
MVKIEIGAAAPGGYVRAVFSSRVGGHAAPVDLIRAQLGAAARLALRRRLRVEFSGYLATDSDDDDLALRRLEICGRKYEAKAAPFAAGRGWYAPHFEPAFVTGAAWPIDCRRYAAAGGPLDAPEWFPAGACYDVGADGWVIAQLPAARGYISEDVPEPFAPGREKYRRGVDRLCSSGFWFINSEQCGALDAPMFIAAGSFREFEDRDAGAVRAPRIIMRAGWL